MVDVDDLVAAAGQVGIDLLHDGRTTYPDFCFDPMPVDGQIGGLRPGALVVASMLVVGAPDALELAGHVVRALGHSRTVWAIRHRDGAVSWEVYVYNTGAVEAVSLAQFAAALAPSLRVDLPTLPDGLPADVYSVDVDAAALAGEPVRTLHVYLPGPGLGRRGGYSYRIDPSGLTMENTYAVYSLPDERSEFELAAAAAPHLRGYRGLLGDPLPVDLAAATLLHLAHKPTVDGLYLSRMAPAAVAAVVESAGWPPEFVSAVRDDLGLAGGVLLDLGADVRLDPSGCHVVGTTVFACL